jgi:hypothetical protein
LTLTARYSHPSGERLDPHAVAFSPPPGTPPPRIPTRDWPEPWTSWARSSSSFGAFAPGPGGADEEELAYAE